MSERVVVWIQQFKDRAALMLQWHDLATGKRKSRSAKTANPEKAEQARADLEYELNHGQYQEASRMTWERFRELFEEEYASGLREGTQGRYTYVFNLFEEIAAPRKLQAVNERTISRFVGELRKRQVYGRTGMGAGTIRVTLQYLRTALNWAAGQKMIPECPAFPSIKVPRKKPQPVPLETFERLLARAPDQNMRVYLLTGWLAGLRLSEAALLEWEATEEAPYLDLLRERIVLPAKFAKSDEDQWVPLDPLLKQEIQTLPRTGSQVFRFVTKSGRQIGVSGISERVIRLAKVAGVKLTMHTLRKGFGCHYAATVSAQVLQKLMRHGDIKTTMAFYANVDDAVRAAIAGNEQQIAGVQRNSSRNSEQAGENDSKPGISASPCDVQNNEE